MFASAGITGGLLCPLGIYMDAVDLNTYQIQELASLCPAYDSDVNV